MYQNYHKHDHKGNIITLDTHIKASDYIERMKELGHNIYFTTQHGFGGDIFEARKLCDKEGFKCVYAAEAYIVSDINNKKDNSNYHIILIARTNKGRRQITKMISNASIDYFYYKPRIDIKELLEISPKDIFITTACVFGILNDDNAVNDIFLKLLPKFKGSLFLECQSHMDDLQKNHNKKVISLSEKYNIPIIHANDSHYIYPSQAKDRITYLNGKGMKYEYEDNFILDYPDEKTIIKRYEKQGVLSKSQILESINNTNIFETCEAIDINYEVKMPTIYSELDIEEKHKLLRKIIMNNFKKICEIEKINNVDEYIKEINFEFKIIKDTQEVRTVDYFLLNEKIIDLAKNKYNGVLTKSGRGSNCAFYINRLLGFTEMTRINSEIPLYPTRFMSVSRILESKSLPDNDLNTKNPEPFIKATKEVLGENGCHWMIAYGTMQRSEAFRNLCRTLDLEYNEVNEVAKNLDEYINDKKWGKIIKESEKYIGTIHSASQHPCANLLMTENILEEVGLIKTKEGLCALIDSSEADDWKYLKNDYLTVKVWKLIDNTYKLINKPIKTIIELKNSLNDKVWELYSKGITTTINQVDSDWTTDLVKRYKPKSIEELAKFISCIRPFFAEYKEKFINREYHTTGIKYLDEIFKPTDHYILFQENLMQFLIWLGIKEDKTVTIIKKISKKTMEKSEFKKIESTLRKNWIKNTGSENRFDETWELIQAHLKYGFNSPHALSMAYDSLYCADLKINHPYEYFSEAFNEYSDDKERTEKLSKELKHFNISLQKPKFRFSKSKYFFDKNSKSIYQGIESIKGISEKDGDLLYNLKDEKFKTFIDLLIKLTDLNINKNKIEVLIKINFFEEFGMNKKLLKVFYNFKDSYKKVTHVNKNIEGQYSLFDQIDFSNMVNNDSVIVSQLKEYELNCKNEKLSIQDQIKSEIEIFEAIHSKFDLPNKYVYIMDYNIQYSPRFKGYALKSGKNFDFKIPKKEYNLNPIISGKIIELKSWEEKNKKIKKEDEWVECDTKEWWVTNYRIVMEQ